MASAKWADFFGYMQKEGHRHYSEKGGHFLRGLRQKVDKAIEQEFPHFSPRGINMQPLYIEADWTKRRYMRRIPRDGR